MADINYMSSEVIQGLPFDALYTLSLTNKRMRQEFNEVVRVETNRLNKTKDTTYLELFCRDDVPLVTRYVAAKHIMTRLPSMPHLMFPERYFDLGLILGAPFFTWPAVCHAVRWNNPEFTVSLGVKLLTAPKYVVETLTTGLSSVEGLAKMAPTFAYGFLAENLTNEVILTLLKFLTLDHPFDDATLMDEIRVVWGPLDFKSYIYISNGPIFTFYEVVIITILLNLPSTFKQLFTLKNSKSVQEARKLARSSLLKRMNEQWLDLPGFEALFTEFNLIDKDVYLRYLIKHQREAEVQLGTYYLVDIVTVLQDYHSADELPNLIYQLIRQDPRIRVDLSWPSTVNSEVRVIILELLQSQPRTLLVHLTPDLYDSTLQALSLFTPYLRFKLLQSKAMTQAEIDRLRPYILPEDLEVSFVALRRLVEVKSELLAKPLSVWPVQNESNTARVGTDSVDVTSWAGSSERLEFSDGYYFGWLMACYRLGVDLPREAYPGRVYSQDILWALREFEPKAFVAYVRSKTGEWPQFEEAVRNSNIVEALE